MLFNIMAFDWVFILNILVQSGLIGFGIWLYRNVKQSIRDWNAKNAVLTLTTRDLVLGERLASLYEQILTKGFADLKERHEMEELYSQYRTLGGNGAVKKMMDRLTLLPYSEDEVLKFRRSSDLVVRTGERTE